jgi:trehalose 6-phosphate phosphatase
VQALTRLPGYHLQPGDHVVELRPSHGDKGAAIAAFMEEAPFQGRRPVFIGDDLTDEHGFEIVNAHGGVSVLVGDREGTLAEHRLADIGAVYAWLGATA